MTAAPTTAAVGDDIVPGRPARAGGPLLSKDKAHHMAQAGPLGGFTTEGE